MAKKAVVSVYDCDQFGQVSAARPHPAREKRCAGQAERRPSSTLAMMGVSARRSCVAKSFALNFFAVIAISGLAELTRARNLRRSATRHPAIRRSHLSNQFLTMIFSARWRISAFESCIILSAGTASWSCLT